MSDDIFEILDEMDIEAYLDREGIEYKSAHGSSGAQLNLKTCPECGGDKWKVFLNAESGLGNCFSGSCNAKFNKWKFVKAYTGLGGRELGDHIRAVGAEIGWRPPRKSVAPVHIEVKELKLPKSFPVPIRGRNLAYLQNRGISIEIAEYFHLRYCQKGWFSYYDAAQDRERFVPFDNRIIIPVFDIDGKMVSFQGRDVTGKAEKKYLFPNGYASTGEHLYNSHNVHDTERVVANEGVFDVAASKIALDEVSDLRDVVPIGTFGKHLSVNQLSKFRILKDRGVREVTFMWDGELAAIDAAIDAALLVRGIGLKTRIAILPKDKDPNEIPASELRRCFYAAENVDLSTAAKIKMKCRMR